MFEHGQDISPKTKSRYRSRTVLTEPDRLKSAHSSNQVVRFLGPGGSYPRRGPARDLEAPVRQNGCVGIADADGAGGRYFAGALCIFEQNKLLIVGCGHKMVESLNAIGRRLRQRSPGLRIETNASDSGEDCCAFEDAIAGKPAPTGLDVFPDFVRTTNNCGSGLARDDDFSSIAKLSSCEACSSTPPQPGSSRRTGSVR